ncbi:Hydrogenase maturation factor HypB [subsurface metagenome]
MGSPGSGKTSILERLIPMLPGDVKAAVIEGDLATSRDAERIAKTGVQSTQINTQGACHLDAAMVRTALEKIDLDDISILFIENVGNLICPAGFSLGETGRIIVSSITEGDDKPEKYPAMFKNTHVVLLNKVDLISQTNFRVDNFTREMKKINPQADIMQVSATNGSGFTELVNWVVGRLL